MGKIKKCASIISFIAFLMLEANPTCAVTFDYVPENELEETGINVAEDIVIVGVYIHGCGNLHNPPYLNMDGYRTVAEDASEGTGETYYAQMFVARGIYNVEIEYSEDDKDRFHMLPMDPIDTTEFSATEVNMLPDIYIEDDYSEEEAESEKDAWLNEKVPKLGTIKLNIDKEPSSNITIIIQNTDTEENYEFTYSPGGPFVETLAEGSYKIVEIDSPKGSDYKTVGEVTDIVVEQGKVTTIKIEDTFGRDAVAESREEKVKEEVDEVVSKTKPQYIIVLPVVVIYAAFMLITFILKKYRRK